MKFNRYSFSSIKGSFIPSLLQNKTCVSTSKSQPPTRPDPTQNRKAAASAAAFPDHHNIVVLDQAIINGHKVMHKDSVDFLY